jgi:hypothetical protein
MLFLIFFAEELIKIEFNQQEQTGAGGQTEALYRIMFSLKKRSRRQKT